MARPPLDVEMGPIYRAGLAEAHRERHKNPDDWGVCVGRTHRKRENRQTDQDITRLHPASPSPLPPNEGTESRPESFRKVEIVGEPKVIASSTLKLVFGPPRFPRP
jgi:hypothetical protein